jgi:hypothetical protein
MFNLNATLDNLIALVVVLLALSLVVQAVQATVKKAFKLKSRQIEDSLAHLFQFVLANKTNGQKEPPKQDATDLWANQWKGFRAMLAQSPFLRIFLRWLFHPAADPDPDYEQATKLYNEVVNRFRGLGRTALSTRPMFDSLAKSDLLKVIASIEPEKIDNAFGANIGVALGELNKFLGLFQEWTSWLDSNDFKTAAGFLSDDDKAKLVAMQAMFKPLLDDIHLLLTGTTGPGQVIASLAKDVSALQGINLDDAQTVLDDVRGRVIQAATRAQTNNQPDVATALNALADKLKDLADGYNVFRQKYKVVFARWVKLEESFDAVMQSFEERYTRSMKTAAIIISFLVVVFLNANFFKVYVDISTSDAKRELILQSREQVERALTAQPNPNSTPIPNETDTQKKEREKKDQEARTQQTVEAWFTASKKQIDDSASTFTGYGFAPITPHDTVQWLQSLKFWRKAEGREMTIWETGDWRRYRYHDIKVLLGWIIMALLLSVGAPFWQDALESLFGVKNLLRKRSDTKNVEDQGGQPKP